MSPKTTTLRKLLWTVLFTILLFGTQAESAKIEPTFDRFSKHSASTAKHVEHQSFDYRRREPASRPRITLARPSGAELAAFLSSKDWFGNSGFLGTSAIFATSAAAGREVRIVGSPFSQGEAASITVDMDAQGDENAIGFTLNFDPTKLTYVSVVRGVDSTGTTLNVNTLQLASGRIGLAIAFPSELTYVAGTRHVVVVTFNVGPAATGNADFSFGDIPIAREIADVTANVLTATYVPASIPINLPPSPVPVVTGTTPGSTIAGGGDLAILVEGNSFVNSSIVRFNGTNLVTTFENSAQLTAVIPAAALATAGSASISVFTPSPGGGLSNVVGFSVNNPLPVLASLSPASVTAGGGGSILTVNGTGFVNGSVVRAGGIALLTTFVSSTQLTADLTAEDIASAGTLSITVQTPGPGGGTSIALGLVVNNPLPSVSTLNPASVTAGGAAFTLTVTGSNFVSTSTVKFNGSNRPTTFVNGSQLTANISEANIATAGNFAVTVDNPAPGGGASNAVNLTVNNPAPVMTEISTTSVTVGGAAFTMTVNGSGFVNGSVVRFAGSPRGTTFVSNSQLTAQITAADIQNTGDFAITVFNPGPGGGISAPLNLAVNNPAPTLTSIAPTGKIAGDSDFILTATGTNFVNGAVVRLNGSPRLTNFVDATSLTAQVSAADIQTAGTLAVSVLNPAPGGGASNSINFEINNPAPALASLSPASATAGSGALTLTVNGSGFISGSVVHCNGGARTTAFISSTQLTADLTAGDIASAGTLSITVQTAGPGGGTSNALGLTVNNPLPSVATLNPANVTAGAGAFTLTVNGTNFVSGSTVKFNGSNRPSSFVNSGQLTADLSAADVASAGNFSVTVDSPAPGGGSSNAVNLTVNNPAPVMSAISPSSVTVGGAAFTLTVNGSGFVNGSVVRFAGSDRSTSFVSSSELTAQITAADIQNTGSFTVTVFNAAPGGGSSAGSDLTVTNPSPTLTAISPASKIAGEGDFILTATGTNFVNGAVVRLNGSDRPTTFGNATSLTAQVSAADIQTAGTLAVSVLNPAPGGGASNSLNLEINNPAPALASLSPTDVIAGSGALTLTVNGSGFISGSVVHVSGTARATTFVSSTQLTAELNAGDIASAGSLSITVQTAGPGGGTSNALSLTVNNPLPSVTALSPASVTASAGAFTLTVNGSNFVSSSTVKFNGSNRPTTFVNSGQLTAGLSAADIATAGNFLVAVDSPAPGGGSSNAVDLTVNNPAPLMIAISPASVSVGGAAFTLTVNGSGFVNGSVVRFAGTDRSTSFVSVSELTAQITAADIQNTGDFAITVFNPAPGGGSSSNIDLNVANLIPNLTSISPASKIAGEGDFILTATGTNFVNGAVIRLNGSERPTTFGDATSLTTQVSAADIQTAGTLAVSVLNPAPGGGTSNTLNLEVNNPAPALASLSPTDVMAGSGALTLTVNGSGFISGSVVHAGGSARATAFVSSTQLTAELPASDVAGAGTLSITVQTAGPGGGTSNALTFTVNNPLPSITELNPNSITANGATISASTFTLTVNGSNFVNSSMVKFNGSNRPTTFVNSGQLTADLSAADVATAGNFSVTVDSPAPGGGASNSMTLTVNNPGPVMTGISPATVSVGGAAFTLTINGSGFVNGSVVRFAGSDRNTAFVSDTELTAQITAADIQNTGNFAISVFNAAPGGGSSANVDLNVENPGPTLTSISPASKITGEGDFILTATGTNFVDGAVVRLNGSDRPTTYVNATSLTAQVSAADIQTAGTLAVSVLNPAPGGGTTNTLNLEVNNPAPALTSLSPTNVMAGSGALTLTVNGSGFIDGSVVNLNGTSRATTFVSSTQLTADVQADEVTGAATLSITVQTAGPGGGTSNALSFTVNNPLPTITSLSPATATTGTGGFTLTVNGSNFVNTSTVKFNGSNRATTFVNSGQLTADLSAADIATAGSFPVTVNSPAPGGGASNAVNLAIENPMPTLVGVSPASATAGGAAFTMSVTGTGFVNGAIVRVNGSNRSTSFVDSSHLTAQITALDIASIGTLGVTVANPGPGGGISNAMNLTINPPAGDTRALRVLDVTTTAGTNVVVLIEMVAKGDENSWGFSLLFDPNQLSFVSANSGADVPTASLLVNSTAAVGHLGIAGALPAGAVVAAGARQILSVTFAVPTGGNLESTEIKFDDFPIAREVVDINAVPLSTAYLAGIVTIARGFEADVAPRPDGNGDGTVTVQDWNQVGRFMALLDDVSLGSEFQRADCSPKETRGDGRLSVADWTQAGRYAAILDPVAFAGGPQGPVSAAAMEAAMRISSEAKIAESVVRMDVLGMGSGSLSIILDARGSENAVGFSLTFDSSKLKFLGVEKGADASEAMLQTNLTGLKKGRVGFAIALPTNQAFPSGKFELMKINFAMTDEGFDSSMLRFADLPIDREVADLNATPMNAAFVIDGGRDKNPIDEPEFFVRQQYLDFLGRAPDLGGLEYWTSQIAECGGDAGCAQRRRIGVSAAFFVDQEFQQTGFFVHRLFKVLLGRQPAYSEFTAERGTINAGAGLERDKSNLIQAWLTRRDVQAKYPAGLGNEAFVDALLDTVKRGSGVDLSSERQRLVDMAGNQGRAMVVRDLIDNPNLARAEYNSAFVLAEYFGYLRRDPDPRGYEFWLNVLNNRVQNNYRAMVCAFITSQEYQKRFGSVITRSNAECGP